jgi:hypothetical protein
MRSKYLEGVRVREVLAELRRKASGAVGRSNTGEAWKLQQEIHYYIDAAGLILLPDMKTVYAARVTVDGVTIRQPGIPEETEAAAVDEDGVPLEDELAEGQEGQPQQPPVTAVAPNTRRMPVPPPRRAASVRSAPAGTSVFGNVSRRNLARDTSDADASSSSVHVSNKSIEELAAVMYVVKAIELLTGQGALEDRAGAHVELFERFAAEREEKINGDPLSRSVKQQQLLDDDALSVCSTVFGDRDTIVCGQPPPAGGLEGDGSGGYFIDYIPGGLPVRGEGDRDSRTITASTNGPRGTGYGSAATSPAVSPLTAATQTPTQTPPLPSRESSFNTGRGGFKSNGPHAAPAPAPAPAPTISYKPGRLTLNGPMQPPPAVAMQAGPGEGTSGSSFAAANLMRPAASSPRASAAPKASDRNPHASAAAISADTIGRGATASGAQAPGQSQGVLRGAKSPSVAPPPTTGMSMSMNTSGTGNGSGSGRPAQAAPPVLPPRRRRPALAHHDVVWTPPHQ